MSSIRRGLSGLSLREVEMEELMEMHSPAHPGEVLKELYLEPLGLSVTEAAALGSSDTQRDGVLDRLPNRDCKLDGVRGQE